MAVWLARTRQWSQGPTLLGRIGGHLPDSRVRDRIDELLTLRIDRQLAFNTIAQMMADDELTATAKSKISNTRR